MAVSTIPQPVKPLVDSLGTRVGDLETGATGLGTRVGNLETVINNFLIDGSLPGSAGFHNSIFRGKSLGGSVTEAQYAAIGAGTFDGLFIGDYWTINNVNWRIAAFDYWLNTGDYSVASGDIMAVGQESNVCQTHHIVIVPDDNLLTGNGISTHWLNSTDNTDGGYVGTDFYAATNGNTGKATCLAAAKAAFGNDHILTHREALSNSCLSGSTNMGFPTSRSWYDSDIELMNEYMVYGYSLFGTVLMGGGDRPPISSIGTTQLPLFALAPKFITNRKDWSLRDPANSTHFVTVGAFGDNTISSASSTVVGIRPIFGVKG